MAFKLSWLASVLRVAGLTVIEQPNWENHGRGEMGTVRGVLCHHTAGPRTGNAPSLHLIEHGRPDLAGPLSHLCLARDGTFFVIAAGRCNHAGAGNWQGVTAGNSCFIGIEAENAGTGDDPWPEVQIAAYARGVAAILNHIGEPAIMCAGHKEFAQPRGRKIDPSFDMAAFRKRVEAYLAAADHRIVEPSTFPVPAADPVRDMLQRGDHGPDVKHLQQLLGIDDDGDFGDDTETAVKAFQAANGLTSDGKAGPKTWSKLATK